MSSFGKLKIRSFKINQPPVQKRGLIFYSPFVILCLYDKTSHTQGTIVLVDPIVTVAGGLFFCIKKIKTQTRVKASHLMKVVFCLSFKNKKPLTKEGMYVDVAPD